ncbi:Protein O-mannosyltransferase 2 [Coemansia spiralis]|uniref:Dolichyl-phosphate-mannose--protein mannosyltransferase n=2 Tax=Coemansia TaxID=4863 RepID=A0A9W8GE74_9FUNG|nr:Dolichyl-phosphate-mannose-protein mannosyltransferase-domain-containing protein [Coemansia spiralis]KAJ1995671.1 Protein O-mannosyltransferase 2 [Coemansia umbellata]KAJ2623723.1 Protein O-mannosyltransferase 2 [Coemansia sp. RSA 1358]KAJ2680358.1 Protein O-mannosyltransferase 2 [Coemansia spiralis]
MADSSTTAQSQGLRRRQPNPQEQLVRSKVETALEKNMKDKKDSHHIDHGKQRSPSQQGRSGVKATFQDRGTFDTTDRVLSVALTLICLFTRLYRIGRRPVVSWDETHFGKFGAYYINGTFYHDVHPPLAKMLVGLGEFISGHDGSFIYKSGATYPAGVNYTLQRAFVAAIGAFIVPFAYRTCRFLDFSRATALAAASFVLMDNALCVISRFILLDPPLLCFTAMSLLGYAAFAAQKQQPFSSLWWWWLTFTGTSLGLVVSSKWVGLFAVALVGLCTVEELFLMYTSRNMKAIEQLKHWGARVLCLIFIPVAIYISCFALHFALLGTRGTGDYKMPSAFQALQYNSVVANQPHDIAYGSLVTLRSHLPVFGLIHVNSTFKFPDYDNEILAAGIPGKQKYNWWRVVSIDSTWENDTLPVQHITDNSIVRLVHNGTNQYLRTGRNPPYHFGWDRRVFVGGNETSTSLWDLWRVRIVSEESPLPRGQLYTVTTTFQLYNTLTGCLLKATQEEFPEWGRRMSELICTEANNTRSESTLWNIEQVRDKRFKRANFRHLVKRHLLRDIIWINREMALSNNKLIADHDRYKHTESSPWSWPFLLYPMRLAAWNDKSIKYYEVGNPVTWWASTLCCFLYPLQLLYWLVRWRRGLSVWQPSEFHKFWDTTKLLWGGWALHYLPFFLMGRVTYLHHYLPALYFALLLLAYEIQCLVRWYLPRGAMWPVALLAMLVAGYVFIRFLPLTFGFDKPVKDLSYLAWLPTWNIVSNKNVN